MTEVPLYIEFLVLFLLVAGLFGVFLGARRLRPGDRRYQAGIAVGLVTGLLLFWVNGAVGIIGASSNDANLMYAGVLFVAAVGAAAARLRPAGMARAMAGAAAAQGIVGVVALVGGLGEGAVAWPGDVIAATIVFIGL